MTTSAELRSGKGSGDENFPVASVLIAPKHRAAVLAFYEFVRVADDIELRGGRIGRPPLDLDGVVPDLDRDGHRRRAGRNDVEEGLVASADRDVDL